MDSALEVRAGRRRGRKGAASAGLSTSLLMLLIMTADWRLVAVLFSLSPLSRRGTTMARQAPSTDWTKVTPASSCMISGTCLGLVMAITIFSDMCSMSLFPMMSHAARMAAVEAVLTCFLVSHMHAVTSGTTSGRLLESCLGEVSENLVIMSTALTLICHFCSTGSILKMKGRRAFMAKGEIFSAIFLEQAVAASLTGPDLLAAAVRTFSRQTLR
mmetsp:Transcript_6905/g.13844  ORF Transcript_6905/g.13844 Transcript_6905/m.13844 type:complete len:215 (-) Transcript_6905:244-888(-)